MLTARRGQRTNTCYFCYITASRLTVADGIGEVSDVVGARQSGVAVSDGHFVLMREAGDGRQHETIHPLLGGHRQEVDSESMSFGRLVERQMHVRRCAGRQDDSEECHVRPTFTVSTTACVCFARVYVFMFLPVSSHI